MAKLANALRRLGVKGDDRIGTFCWNSQEHFEAYLAVPAMGAVLHTLNLRLAADEVGYIVNHARDRFVIVHSTLVPLLAAAAKHFETVEKFIVIGAGDASALKNAVRYEELLADADEHYDWPELDERSACTMCYTSGTTGRSKGVVYSHRSTFLHAFGIASGSCCGIGEKDRILPIVPMFHANAWGFPHAAWLTGADLLLPGAAPTPAAYAKMIAEERPTLIAGVPTVFRDLLVHGEQNRLDLSSVRSALCGGSAVPSALMERYEREYGLKIIQGWGLTETSPVAALAIPPKDLHGEPESYFRNKAGRMLGGVEIRVVNDAGKVLPHDGKAEGELEVRGPWVTGAYYGDPTPEKFHDGWLRTGDVGNVDPEGFVTITDRAKDVIKSGGEWISSVAVENLVMSHPAVREAAVIGVPDDKWQERPLACVVFREGQSASPEELAAHVAKQVVSWWVPERWTFVAEVPKTSVGKFDKKVIRARYAAGELTVHSLKPS